MQKPTQLTIGTRGSALALWQTNHVSHALTDAFPNLVVKSTIFKTRGDKELDKPLPEIGGKGLFTAELEAALLRGDIDLAVHSLKDLPTENPPGLTIGAILPRENPVDVLISRNGFTLETLPEGATVGTSSLRRQAQLLAQRPDLRIISLRGNVDTRIRKAMDPAGPYHAIVLAAAGVQRMNLTAHVSQYLDPETMLPAPGQGAVAVQCRAADEATLGYLAAIHHQPTALAVQAERDFLAGLGGGCSVPVGAFARVEGDTFYLEGLVASTDGQTVIRVQHWGDDTAAGAMLARTALAQGADALLELPNG